MPDAHAKHTCPKCEQPMELVYLGYLLMNNQYGPALPVRCVQGDYGKANWRGHKAVKIRKQYGIDTYRCTSCGFLENYAATEVEE